jgi:transposase
MFYAALDVSLRSVAVCIIDHGGKICFERSVRFDVPDVLRCLAAFGPPIHQVGFEAGALTQPIIYGLVEAGYDVVCMEAR